MVTGRNSLALITPLQFITPGFRAFVKANRGEKEIMPPGLNLTSQQLFWVGYAQEWCLLSNYYDTFEETLNYEGVILRYIKALLYFY